MARRATVASRATLLSHVEPVCAANLPIHHGVIGQLLSDLTELNQIDRLSDGSVPLEAWLRQAVLMTNQADEGRILRRALEKVAVSNVAAVA
jgi:endonuclease G, mitochondrial